MVDTIDTNIFIFSIYDNLSNKAIIKFLEGNHSNILPCYLYDEIHNKFIELGFIFKNILHKMKKGEFVLQIIELNELKKDFSNIYNYLSNSTLNFSDQDKIQEKLDFMIKYSLSLISWLEEISYYPNNEKEEKGILKKYMAKKNKLLNFEELHNADLKIVIIFNHYCSKKINEIGRLVTGDLKLYSRKNEVEHEFSSFELIKVEEYV